MPRVSAVVPTRDRRGMLARALASIDAQSFRDFEIVVVDDGSVDGTAAWLRANRPEISVVETAHSTGAAAARNRGVERSRGDIIAFLDDDDVWHPSYLEVQVAQFDACPDADVCTTGHVELDQAGRTSLPDLRPLFEYSGPLVHMLAECPIHTLSVVACRRAAFDRIGGFDESLSIVHDLDWYCRLIESGGRMRHDAAIRVGHTVPGGLVTKHRRWFAEERSVHRRIISASENAHWERRRIRALRALFFARLALRKGDLPFAFLRLSEALLSSPLDAVRIASRRLLRRGDVKAWDAGSWQTP